MTSDSLLFCLFINIPTNGPKGSLWAPDDVTDPNSNGETLSVSLHNQLMSILSNNNKKFLSSHHVGNCYLKACFLSRSRQQSEVFSRPHKYKNVLIFSAGWNWRLWSTLKSDLTIIKVKIKLKDKWSVLNTLSIIPLGQAVSTVTEQFYFFKWPAPG